MNTEKKRESSRLCMSALYAGRRALRLCTQCGAAAVPERVMCSDCLARAASGYNRKRRKRQMAQWALLLL